MVLVFLGVMAILFVMATTAALLLSGDSNGHDRRGGHSDITFSISPRGDELVFNAIGEGGRDLYRLTLTSLKVTQIASTPSYEVDPEYSPDGMSVVYAAGDPSDRADHIFLRSLDGKSLKQLTKEDANDASPAFSPDGSLIVFTRDKTYNWGGLASNWDAGGVLCVMGLDGTGPRQITEDGSMAFEPRFSPDGKTILFWSEDEVYTVAADGSEPPRPLGGLIGREPTYSPDGRSIAFSRGRYSPDSRIFTARADGSDPQKLTRRGEEEDASPNGGRFRPAFMPDGKQIRFFLESWPDGSTGFPKESLWAVDIDGNNLREIADYSLFDDPLHWRPRQVTSPKGPGR